MIGNIVIAIIGFGQNPIYYYSPKDGVETIAPILEKKFLDCKIVKEMQGIPANIFIEKLEKLEELDQERKKGKNISLEAIIPKNRNYIPEPFERKIKNKYFKNNILYKNPKLKNSGFYKITNRFHGLGRK